MNSLRTLISRILNALFGSQEPATVRETAAAERQLASALGAVHTAEQVLTSLRQTAVATAQSSASRIDAAISEETAAEQVRDEQRSAEVEETKADGEATIEALRRALADAITAADEALKALNAKHDGERKAAGDRIANARKALETLKDAQTALAQAEAAEQQVRKSVGE